MEGRASTFGKVLADFQARLPTAEYVAIDTELTGVDIQGEPDNFDDSALQRLDRICRIAERYTLIQLGLTLVGRVLDGGEGHYSCASYNLFAFPYVGPEVPVREGGFFCQASALQFNAQHKLNFNLWISQGIPYMSREEERTFLSIRNDKASNHVDEKVGLLRLWKALCAARLPFVVHSPLDLFFLLAAFERRPLPRNDPMAVAMLIRRCTPRVYDTAYLHGTLDHFRRLGLMKFYEDVQARYAELAERGLNAVPVVKFRLQGATAGRYGAQLADRLAHEAGYDSLITAQLFAYLRAIAPAQVKEGANKLFLYRSVEFLDLERAAVSGEVARCIFDTSRVTLLVAVLDPAEGLDAPRLIGSAGYTCKRIDDLHLLVVLRASGGAAVRKAAKLAAMVHGIRSWMPFDEWRRLAVEAAAGKRAAEGEVAFAQNSVTVLLQGGGAIDNLVANSGDHAIGVGDVCAGIGNGGTSKDGGRSAVVGQRDVFVQKLPIFAWSGPAIWVLSLLAVSAVGCVVLLVARQLGAAHVGGGHQLYARGFFWRRTRS